MSDITISGDLMQNKGRKLTWILSAIGAFSLLVIATIFWWIDWLYLPVALGVMLLLMVPRFIWFERDQISIREMVLIALFAALAAISRVPFAAIPSVQPMSAIIILAAFVFGPNLGFMVGAVSALASNMLLGQGPWTPWQMFAWGMMGYMLGLLSGKKIKPITLAVIGFSSGILFGWVMNLWFLLGYIRPLTVATVLPVYISSLTMDLAHGASNFTLILLLYKPFIRMFQRIQVKYELDH